MFKSKLLGFEFLSMFLLVISLPCQTRAPARTNTVPRLEQAVLPHYPAIAEAAHVTGKVVVVVLIENGVVVKADAQLDDTDSSPAIVRYLLPATLLNIKTWHFGNDVTDSFKVTYTYAFAEERTDIPTNPKIEMSPSLDVKITAYPVKPKCMDGCPPD